MRRSLFFIWVPQARGPHGQVLVRGVEISILRPGIARIFAVTISALLLFPLCVGQSAQQSAPQSAIAKRPMTFEDMM